MANGHSGERAGSGRKPKPRAADPEVNKPVKALQEAPPGTLDFEDVQDWIMAVLRREEHPDAVPAAQRKRASRKMLSPAQAAKAEKAAAKRTAAHNAAMECYRRAMIGELPSKADARTVNQANKLSRTWATLLDALNKHRGKGQQKVTVEHIHVHAGGQAVVGTVERPGGGDQTKMEEQPHAKQIAPEITHAPEPALRGVDTERDLVPVARDGERPLPDARGQISGRADRE